MWRKSMTNISITNFEKMIESHPIIILYPQTPYANLFLSYLLENVDEQFLYYRLKTSDTSISSMISNMVSELDASGISFGTVTKKALKNNDIIKLATALAKDVADFHDDAILYLDELDRLDLTDEYRLFFTSFLENLSPKNHFIINSRELTTEPWQKAVLDNVAVVLGAERRQSNLMFSVEEAEKPQLEIYGFGRGRAIINGLEVTSWDGALPRQLFFYFIDKDLITRHEIFDLFWPSLNDKEATNVFHVTKRKIAERLSLNVLDADNYELTNYYEGFYRPGDKIVRHYDVAEFENTVDEASMTFDDDEQANLYRHALNLYQAPLLTSIDMPWVLERREKLQWQLIEALIGLARYHKSADDKDQSLGYFMRAIHQNPLREDIHREVMSLYVAMGYPDEALRQYDDLAVMLQDILGVDPAPETQALRDNLGI